MEVDPVDVAEVEPVDEKASAPEEGFKAPLAPPVKPSSHEEKSEEKIEAKTKSSSKSPAEVAYNSKTPPLAYKEPPWAGLPPDVEPVYVLEEIKNGTIVGTHKLTGKSYFVIGRLPTNDIQVSYKLLSQVQFLKFELWISFWTFETLHQCS